MEFVDQAAALAAAMDIEAEKRGNAEDRELNIWYAERVVEELRLLGFQIAEIAPLVAKPSQPKIWISPAQKRLLVHLSETGAWMPGVDPIEFRRETVDAAIRKGWAHWDVDGKVLHPTPVVAVFFPWPAGGRSTP